MARIQEKNIRKLFIVSLILKGAGSLLEVLGGIMLLFTGKLTSILALYVNGELLEDPTDFVANQIQHFLPYLTGSGASFGALYLLSHGIIKVFLVVNLLRNRLWAYPATLVTLGIFIAYQLYRLTYGYSLFLILLTLFDFLIVILTWHEYRLVKRSSYFSSDGDTR